MTKEQWLYGLVGLLLGIVLTALFGWFGHGGVYGRYGGWHGSMMGGYGYPMMFYGSTPNDARFEGPGMMYWEATSTQR